MQKLIPALLGLLLLFTSCQNSVEDPGVDPGAEEQATATPPDTNEGSKAKSLELEGFTADYSNTNRYLWQQPQLILDVMGDISDKVVADIGAGPSGYFSFLLVQEAKKVIAIDILEPFVDYMDSIRQTDLPGEVQPKLEVRLGNLNDPNLRPSEVDLIFIVNTYMYIQDRTNYLKNLKYYLKPEGRIVIVDFKKKRTSVGPPSELRIPLYIAEQEVLDAQFRRVRTNDTLLDYQYIIIAEN